MFDNRIPPRGSFDHRPSHFIHMETLQAFQTVLTEKAPTPIGPYSQATIAGGLLFTAGQVGLDKSGKLADGVTDQARQALTNLRAVIESGGSSLERVVKTTIFLKDMKDFGPVNAVYAEFFSTPYPARSTV